jgi:hypothetical protein
MRHDVVSRGWRLLVQLAALARRLSPAALPPSGACLRLTSCLMALRSDRSRSWEACWCCMSLRPLAREWLAVSLSARCCLALAAREGALMWCVS